MKNSLKKAPRPPQPHPRNRTRDAVADQGFQADGQQADAPLQPVPSLARRLASIPYEGLLLLALLLIAGFPAAGLGELTLAGIPHIFFQLYLAITACAYFVWQWQKSGQTLPMKTWRFRVVNSDGSKLGWGRAFWRFLCALLFFGPACAGVLLLFFPSRMSPVVTMWFFFPMLATLLYSRFDREQQFLHDRLAGTRLEDAPVPR